MKTLQQQDVLKNVIVSKKKEVISHYGDESLMMKENDELIGRNHVLGEMKSIDFTTTSKDDFTNLSPRD